MSIQFGSMSMPSMLLMSTACNALSILNWQCVDLYRRIAMLSFFIYFVIGYGIALIFRKDIQEVTSKRKYLVSLAAGFLALVLFTGYVSPRAAGMYSAAIIMGSLSAFGSSYEFVKKLKSKYVHIWIIPLMLIIIEMLSGSLQQYNLSDSSNNEKTPNKNSFFSKNRYDEKSLKILINPTFTDAYSFGENGLAPVMTGGEWNGYAISNGLWGFINNKGQFIISPKFEKAYQFTNNLAAVQLDGAWGFINTNGQYVIKSEFTDALSFDDKNMAAVMVYGEWFSYSNKWINGKWGFINNSGSFIINPQFDSALSFSKNGLAAVRVGDDASGKWGYINRSGEYVITPQYDATYGFADNGLAAVRVGSESNGKWGYIDKSGSFVINPQFASVSDFSSNGMAAASTDGYWDRYMMMGQKFGFIDQGGNFVINPKYDFASSFVYNDLAWVSLDKKTYFIDDKDNIVYEPSFQIMGDPSDDLFLVKIGDKYGYASFGNK